MPSSAYLWYALSLLCLPGPSTEGDDTGPHEIEAGFDSGSGSSPAVAAVVSIAVRLAAPAFALYGTLAPEI